MFGKKRNTFAILTGVSMAALGAATPAIAQAQEQARVSDEIIVTAQKRAQDIQDVPIAVTALSGDQLQRAGIQDIRALQTLSASFNLNSSQTESGGTTIRIRGVGTTGNNAGLESSVGVFIDGVYVSRPSVALGELLDVQQVEILRGPQGTLFGRNTSAGALTITTRAPSFDKFGAFGNMTFGEVDGRDLGSLASVQGGVNIPVIQDKLAFRVSAAARTRDGLLTTTATDSVNGRDQNTRDRYIIRGQALFAPTENITLRLIADYQEGNDDCCDAVILRETPLLPFYAAAGLPANGGVAASGQSALESRTSNGQGFKDPGEQTGFSAQLDWDLGWSNLTYIGSTRNAEAGPNVQDDFTGIRTYSVGGVTAAPGGYLRPNGGESDYTSHEIRLAGENGRLNWLVGGYYGTEDINTGGTLTLGSDFQRNLNANIYGAFAGSGLVGAPAITGFFTAALTPSLGAPTAAAVAAGLAANPAAVFSGGASSTGAYATNVFTQNGETTSIFTHDTFSVTDKLDITVGARYVEETKDGRFQQLAASNPACAAANANPLTGALGGAGALAKGFLCFPFAVPVGLTNGLNLFNKTFKDDELVYTANASYAFTPNINGYASLTHGFKSGGFNLDPTAARDTDPSALINTPADPRFKSEKVDSYEIGVKADLFDRRLRANVAVFTSEITDFQVLEFTGVQFQTFNVPKVQADGVEMELNGRVTDSLNASLAVTYTDARYPTDCAPATASPVIRTLCGSDLTNAPPLVSIFGLNYDHAVGANGRIFAAGSIRWEDDRRTSTQAYEVNATGPVRTTKVFNDIQEANSKTNLRFGYGAQDESWTVELWGTNIFNEQTRNVTFNTPLRGFTAATTSRGAFLEEPALYGVTIRANY